MKLKTTFYAINSSKDNKHTGFYDEEVYKDLMNYHSDRHDGFQQRSNQHLMNLQKSFM